MSDLSRAGALVQGSSARQDELGFTLLEISIAAVISLVMITVVFLTASATLGAQEQASEEGATTAPTMLAANAVEQLVNNAFVPNATTTITSNCYDPSGGGTPLTATDGPFVPSSRPTTSSLYICAIRPGTAAAYTYEITFATCGGTSCLAIDRLNCSSGCTTTRIDDFPGVSNTDPFSSVTPPPPFTYYYESGSGWTNVTPPFNDSTVNLVTAISLDFWTPTSHGKAQKTEVKRTVLLPPELGGYG